MKETIQKLLDENLVEEVIHYDESGEHVYYLVRAKRSEADTSSIPEKFESEPEGPRGPQMSFDSLVNETFEMVEKTDSVIAEYDVASLLLSISIRRSFEKVFLYHRV